MHDVTGLFVTFLSPLCSWSSGQHVFDRVHTEDRAPGGQRAGAEGAGLPNSRLRGDQVSESSVTMPTCFLEVNNYKKEGTRAPHD